MVHENNTDAPADADAPADIIHCPHCQAPARKSDNPVFCMKCGLKFENNPSLNSTHSHTISLGSTRATSPYNVRPRGNMAATDMRGQHQRYNQRANRRQYRKPKTWSLGGGFGVSIVSLILAGIMSVALIFMILMLNIELTSTLSLFILGSASIMFLVYPAYWVQKYYAEPLSFPARLKELGLPFDKYSKPEVGRELLLGALLGLVAVVIVVLLQVLSYYVVLAVYGIDPYALLAGSGTDQFDLIGPATGIDLALFIMMILLFVGLPEEILFRGFVQRSFEAKLTRPSATLLTAVFFGGFHIITLILVPSLFLFMFIPYLGISLFIGLVRNWRKDLYAAISLHIVYDIIQTIIIFIILT